MRFQELSYKALLVIGGVLLTPPIFLWTSIFGYGGEYYDLFAIFFLQKLGIGHVNFIIFLIGGIMFAVASLIVILIAFRKNEKERVMPLLFSRTITIFISIIIGLVISISITYIESFWYSASHILSNDDRERWINSNPQYWIVRQLNGGFAGPPEPWLLMVCKNGKIGQQVSGGAYVEGWLDNSDIEELKNVFKRNNFFSLSKEYYPILGLVSDSIEHSIIYSDKYKFHSVTTDSGRIPPERFSIIDQKLLEITQRAIQDSGSGFLEVLKTFDVRKWPFSTSLSLGNLEYIQNSISIKKEDIPENVHDYFRNRFFPKFVDETNIDAYVKKDGRIFTQRLITAPSTIFLENYIGYYIQPQTNFLDFQSGKMTSLSIQRFRIQTWNSDIELSAIDYRFKEYIEGDAYHELKNIINPTTVFIQGGLQQASTGYLLNLISAIKGDLSTGVLSLKFCQERGLPEPKM